MTTKWFDKDFQEWKKNEYDMNIANKVVELEFYPNYERIEEDDNYLKKKLPREIELFTNLQKLMCIGFDLEELPKEIGQLVNLKFFDCHDNHITKIPEEFGNLINLQELNLTDNRIVKIPEEIGNLINLRYSFFVYFCIKMYKFDTTEF
jgi:Leucine-rich repeat (LRR) protein